MFHEQEIFKGKNFGDLLKDIYKNQNKTSKQVTGLIAQLHPLIKNPSDATVLVPLIKDYLDISVKNDDHLVKLAAVCQRLIAASITPTASNFESLLTEDEKAELLELSEQMEDTKLLDAPTKDEIKDIQSQVKLIDDGGKE
tara:strand:- start:39 stop:461 length:423 start_codon:yes stop_codon:yes gene_type:complete